MFGLKHRGHLGNVSGIWHVSIIYSVFMFVPLAQQGWAGSLHEVPASIGFTQTAVRTGTQPSLVHVCLLVWAFFSFSFMLHLVINEEKQSGYWILDYSLYHYFFLRLKVQYLFSVSAWWMKMDVYIWVCGAPLNTTNHWVLAENGWKSDGIWI